MLQTHNSETNLRARVDFLEEENRQLRCFIGIEPNNAFQLAAKEAFGVSRGQARILQALLIGRVSGVEALMRAYAPDRDDPTEGCLKVQIFRLRQNLARHGLSITNIHGVGYSMSEEDRAHVREILEATEL